jgi:hypothetical protein
MGNCSGRHRRRPARCRRSCGWSGRRRSKPGSSAPWRRTSPARAVCAYRTTTGMLPRRRLLKEALFSGPAGGYDDNDEDLERQGAKVRRLTVLHSGNSSEVIDIKHVIYPDGSTRAGCQIAVTTGWIDVPPIESQTHAPPPPSKQDQPTNPQAFAVFDTGRTPHQFQRRHGPKRKR